MEFCVGLMLILLGVLNLTGAMKWMSEKFSPAHPPVAGEHAHIHEHGAKMHFHWHSHAPQSDHHGETLPPPPALERSFPGLALYQSLRPLFVGIVHGLAGSPAVAPLVLNAIRFPKWAVLYPAVFCLPALPLLMLTDT